MVITEPAGLNHTEKTKVWWVVTHGGTTNNQAWNKEIIRTQYTLFQIMGCIIARAGALQSITFRWLTGHDISTPLFSPLFLFLFFFKKPIQRKLFAVPKNLGFNIFPYPVSYFRAPWWPFCGVRRCWGITGDESLPPLIQEWYSGLFYIQPGSTLNMLKLHPVQPKSIITSPTDRNHTIPTLENK